MLMTQLSTGESSSGILAGCCLSSSVPFNGNEYLAYACQRSWPMKAES